MREWLVIESSRGRGVFASDAERDRKNYIPRDVAEALLGRDLGDGCQWFTQEESEKMRASPEWCADLPEQHRASRPPAGDELDAALGWIEPTEQVIDYVLRYGGPCKGCADEDGVCPASGLPCDHRARQGVTRVINALNYGLKNGFLAHFAARSGTGGGGGPVGQGGGEPTQGMLTGHPQASPMPKYTYQTPDYSGGGGDMVLVPRELSHLNRDHNDMCNAGMKALIEHGSLTYVDMGTMRAIYRAMLAASPRPLPAEDADDLVAHWQRLRSIGGRPTSDYTATGDRLATALSESRGEVAELNEKCARLRGDFTDLNEHRANLQKRAESAEARAQALEGERGEKLCWVLEQLLSAQDEEAAAQLSLVRINRADDLELWEQRSKRLTAAMDYASQTEHRARALLDDIRQTKPLPSPRNGETEAAVAVVSVFGEGVKIVVPTSHTETEARAKAEINWRDTRMSSVDPTAAELSAFRDGWRYAIIEARTDGQGE